MRRMDVLRGNNAKKSVLRKLGSALFFELAQTVDGRAMR